MLTSVLQVPEKRLYAELDEKKIFESSVITDFYLSGGDTVLIPLSLADSKSLHQVVVQYEGKGIIISLGDLEMRYEGLSVNHEKGDKYVELDLGSSFVDTAARLQDSGLNWHLLSEIDEQGKLIISDGLLELFNQ